MALADVLNKVDELEEVERAVYSKDDVEVLAFLNNGLPLPRLLTGEWGRIDLC